MLRRHSRRDRRLKTCHRHVFLTPRRIPTPVYALARNDRREPLQGKRRFRGRSGQEWVRFAEGWAFCPPCRVYGVVIRGVSCAAIRLLGGRSSAPSGRGLSSASETGGENLRFLFSPSVMTCSHDTSLAEGGFGAAGCGHLALRGLSSFCRSSGGRGTPRALVPLRSTAPAPPLRKVYQTLALVVH